jgi:hypothetical protein
LIIDLLIIINPELGKAVEVELVVLSTKFKAASEERLIPPFLSGHALAGGKGEHTFIKDGDGGI